MSCGLLCASLTELVLIYEFVHLGRVDGSSSGYKIGTLSLYRPMNSVSSTLSCDTRRLIPSSGGSFCHHGCARRIVVVHQISDTYSMLRL
ncbi:hypothetical protein L208DRAFT_524225 [Tricholoma matsutake]|nr:hypothetical protein L208DRAFT_524225 [Tricholoma matsutake 945]